MLYRLITWIKKLYWKAINTNPGSQNKEENIIKPLNINKMAKKTVITKVKYDDAQGNIIEFPQNRTLYADQFTDEGPTSDDEREGFKPKNMKEVFEHYQPSKNGIALETEENGAVYEDFEFKSIKDFEDDALIAHSELLGAEKGKIDAYNSVIRQLEKNKTLRNTLKDGAAKGNLKNALKALLAEIEAAE